jgi:hypothetical protein
MVMLTMKCLAKVKMLVVVGMLLGHSFGQDAARVKIAQGEYAVSTDEDLGVGPVDTEVFHFREVWTLWHASDGNYEVDGERNFESPRGVLHQDSFWVQLTKGSAWLRSKNLRNSDGYRIPAR